MARTLPLTAFGEPTRALLARWMAVTTHGDVEGRTCRRRRNPPLQTPTRRVAFGQIEHDHSIRHGADPAPSTFQLPMKQAT